MRVCARLDQRSLNSMQHPFTYAWTRVDCVCICRLPRKAISPHADDESESTTRLFRQYVWESGAWPSDCVKRVHLFYKGDSLADEVSGNNFTIGYAKLLLGANLQQI